MKAVHVLLFVTGLAMTINAVPTIKNKCTPMFTKDGLSVAFDFNQVKPTDASKPENITTDTIKAEFLLCNGIGANVVDPSWNCAYKPEENMVYLLDGNVCYPTTTSDSKLTHTPIKNNVNDITGLVMTYDNSNIPSEIKSKMYKKNLKIILNCNKDIDNANAVWTMDNTDDSYITFTTTAKAGCGLSMKDFFALFDSNRWLFAFMFLLLGIMFTFFGKRFFTITLTLTGFLIGFLSVAGVCYVFSAFQKADNGKVAVLLTISVLLGILTGWIFYKFKVVSTMAAVGVLFFFIGSAIVRLYLSTSITNDTIKTSIVVTCVILGVVFGYFWSRLCIIFATSFGGAFLIIFAIGTATQTLDSPSEIEQKIKRNEKVTLIYIYGAAWLLLGIAGFITQYMRVSKKNETDDSGFDNSDAKYNRV